MKDLKHTLLHIETDLLKKEVRCSVAEIEKRLTDDFYEFGKSGGTWHWDKKPISHVAEKDLSEVYAIEHANVRVLCQHAALLTSVYKNTRTGESVNRSSVYIRDENQCWKMAFHQGTKVT
jgi:hypothetical protein